MFFHRYIVFLFLTLIAGGFSFFMVITRLNPYVTPVLALLLFFICLFFLSSSFFSIVGYSLRVFFFRNELFLNHFNVSLRQGVLAGACLCGLFGLQSMRTLFWWSGLLLLLLTLLLELYFMARE